MSNRFFSLLLLLPLPALAATSEERIQELLNEKRPDKAWEACEKLKEKGELTGTALRELCARADLDNLLSGAYDRARLDRHWQTWAGTSAAYDSRDMASQQALKEAGERGDLLRLVVVNYDSTPGATEALARLWKAALNANTSEALQAFLREFPSAPQATDAQNLIPELSYQEAERMGTIAALQTFQRTYPNHPRAAQALAREQAIAFRDAETANTAAAWQALLQTYPNHPRAAEAKQRLLDAGYTEAERAGSEALLTFAIAHPDYPRAQGALIEAMKARTKAELGSGNQLTTLSISGLITVPAGANTLRITLPSPAMSATAEVLLTGGTQPAPLASALPARLRAAGLPEDALPTDYSVRWEQAGGVLTGRLSSAICQPDGAGFVVVVRGAGVEIGYPFQIDTACTAQAATLKKTTLFKVGTRTFKFGGSSKDFPYTDFVAQTAVGTGITTRCQTSNPGFCADYYLDRLVAIRVRCVAPGCSDTKSAYVQTRMAVTDNLSRAGEITAAAGVASVWSSPDLRAMDRPVSGGWELVVTADSLFRLVKSRVPDYLTDVSFP